MFDSGYFVVYYCVGQNFPFKYTCYYFTRFGVLLQVFFHLQSPFGSVFYPFMQNKITIPLPCFAQSKGIV